MTLAGHVEHCSHQWQQCLARTGIHMVETEFRWGWTAGQQWWGVMLAGTWVTTVNWHQQGVTTDHCYLLQCRTVTQCYWTMKTAQTSAAENHLQAASQAEETTTSHTSHNSHITYQSQQLYDYTHHIYTQTSSLQLRWSLIYISLQQQCQRKSPHEILKYLKYYQTAQSTVITNLSIK